MARTPEEVAKIEEGGRHFILGVREVNAGYIWQLIDQDTGVCVGRHVEPSLEQAKSKAQDCWAMFTSAPLSSFKKIVWSPTEQRLPYSK